MSKLKGKNILLFCPSFYQYREVIRTEIIKQQANVYDFDERPTNRNLFKFFLRLRFNRLIFPIVFKYYNELKIPCEDQDITDVLIINAEAIDVRTMRYLKYRFNKAKFTLYMWDSLNNKKGVSDIIPLFDKSYSFDPKDCLEIESLKFEPLFYGSNYMKHDQLEKSNYDLSFVGSIHSDRLKIVSKITRDINKSYVYLFSPSKLLTFIKMLSSIKIDSKLLVYHDKISLDQVSKVFKKSNAVLDINHPNQKGLTMRTFEVLGAGKKLVTTNSNIKNYDFFSKENILVLDRENIDKNAIRKFVNSSGNYSPKIEKHRIDNWLIRILS